MITRVFTEQGRRAVYGGLVALKFIGRSCGFVFHLLKTGFEQGPTDVLEALIWTQELTDHRDKPRLPPLAFEASAIEIQPGQWVTALTVLRGDGYPTSEKNIGGSALLGTFVDAGFAHRLARELNRAAERAVRR